MYQLATGQELLALDAGEIRPTQLWFRNGGRTLTAHGTRPDRTPVFVTWDPK